MSSCDFLFAWREMFCSSHSSVDVHPTFTLVDLGVPFTRAPFVMMRLKEQKKQDSPLWRQETLGETVKPHFSKQNSQKNTCFLLKPKCRSTQQ